MLRIGVIVNPVAGVGGPAALKGSDGEASRVALANGFLPKSTDRMLEALCTIEGEGNHAIFKTCAGAMGADALVRAGIRAQEEVYRAGAETTALDTHRAARALVESGIDLLLFAGGDGTARDICQAVGNELLCLGVPAGVKMHSGVFAVTPQAAGKVVSSLLAGELVSVTHSEVRDIDEGMLRQGKVNTRYFGELLTPAEGRYLQQVKCGGIESEELVINDIAGFLQDQREPGCICVLGAGTTTFGIMQEWGLEGTLLGVDVVLDDTVVATDVDARTLLDWVTEYPATLVVSITGGQGYLFGRGNQQISADIIREIGLSNICIVSSKAKLKALEGRPLLVDTGDLALNKELCGYRQIVTGYEDFTLYPVEYIG